MHPHAQGRASQTYFNPVYINTYIILSVSSQSWKTALFTKSVMVFEWLKLAFYQLVPHHNFVLNSVVDM